MKPLLALAALMMLGGCTGYTCKDGSRVYETVFCEQIERRINVCRTFCGAGHGRIDYIPADRTHHWACTCDDNRQKEVF